LELQAWRPSLLWMFPEFPPLTDSSLQFPDPLHHVGEIFGSQVPVTEVVNKIVQRGFIKWIDERIAIHRFQIKFEGRRLAVVWAEAVKADREDSCRRLQVHKPGNSIQVLPVHLCIFTGKSDQQIP